MKNSYPMMVSGTVQLPPLINLIKIKMFSLLHIKAYISNISIMEQDHSEKFQTLANLILKPVLFWAAHCAKLG